MKFSAASLAAIAAQGPGDRSNDVTHLTQRHRDSSLAEVLQNKKALPKVVSNIVGKLADLQNVVECDSSGEIHRDDRLLKNVPGYDHQSNAFGDDADFGILSPVCGVGRKCQDGLCVDVEGWDQNQRVGQRFLQTDVNTTTVPVGDDGNSSIIEMMQYACDFGALIGEYDCDCNFQPGYLGNATCTTPVQCGDQTSVCNVNVTDCHQTTYSVVLNGTPGEVNAELCLHFIEPFEQTICYETSTTNFGDNVLPECKLSLDGQMCYGCSVYSYYGENCYNFDCSNTPFAGSGRGSMIGNTCDLPAHTVGLYLDTFGCPECDLCGEGLSMTSPSAYMTLFNLTYECAYVQEVGGQGYFTTDTCAYFSAVAKQPCGCAVVVEEPGTESPTDSIFIDNGSLCKICPDGVTNPDGMLSMPGSTTLTCSEVETAGLDGSIVGEELCEVIQDRASGPCCGISEPSEEDNVVTEVPQTEEYCTLCGSDQTLTGDLDTLVSVPTQGIYTCGELVDLGKNGTLDENGICLLVQLSANTPCRCMAEGATMSPTAVPVDDSSDIPSAATRISMAFAVASVCVTAIVTQIMC